jgi:alpha-amylase
MSSPYLNEMAHGPRISTSRREESMTSCGETCPTNQTMLQGFEWYCPSDSKHWQRLAAAVPSLSALGITSIWIPPATKSHGIDSNGYSLYDLYDLGEFDQKGETCTKWGDKEGLVELVETANSHGIAIIFDVVLNHKAGADYTESVTAVKVDSNGNDNLVNCSSTGAFILC